MEKAINEENNKQSEKLSYEQLEHIARDLTMQRNQLQIQLQNAQSVINNFNDLGMLLSIIDKSKNFNSDFIVRCTERVEKLVTEALDNYDALEKKAKEEQNKK
jgi:hypothetical protein